MLKIRLLFIGEVVFLVCKNKCKEEDRFVQILGIEIVKKINKYYKGQQITFHIRLYFKKCILKRIEEYDGKNLKVLSSELGYYERWLRHLIDIKCK